VTAISPALSPCRQHPCSREHADLVRSFRETVEIWERIADQATKGYEAEMALYLQSHPRPTLKRFLVASRRPCVESEAA
jgi:hypothetical protein